MGTVLLLAIPNFVFNNCDLTSSPTLPGIMVNAKPDAQIKKLSFTGMKIFAFRNSKCHLKKSAKHPDVTSKAMIGMNSILKYEILS